MDQNPLMPCANPRCRNRICPKHAVSFELSDETGTHLDFYCSRECWSELRLRALPPKRELSIAAIVLLIAFVAYATVVNYVSP